ncbi:predicted protein [Plenodomus lingam JN3]|uniref:Predicted protein n=1 Tax=Leptosphaeria maculans (strain JN3 / isolate v23.1.3 / race Av1-4-5-6-7-8) TaxID=985895 RepID=E4ZK14_LEPMJ|nr:predicted protein [Plenodomus lingam JN3]CBX91609.1 predicted protein [Plenodomus lingam JN3]
MASRYQFLPAKVSNPNRRLFSDCNTAQKSTKIAARIFDYVRVCLSNNLKEFHDLLNHHRAPLTNIFTPVTPCRRKFLILSILYILHLFHNKGLVIHAWGKSIKGYILVSGSAPGLGPGLERWKKDDTRE